MHLLNLRESTVETLKYVEVVDGPGVTEVRIHTSSGGVMTSFRNGATVDVIVGSLHRMAAQLSVDAAYRAANKPSSSDKP